MTWTVNLIIWTTWASPVNQPRLSQAYEQQTRHSKAQGSGTAHRLHVTSSIFLQSVTSSFQPDFFLFLGVSMFSLVVHLTEQPVISVPSLAAALSGLAWLPREIIHVHTRVSRCEFTRDAMAQCKWLSRLDRTPWVCLLFTPQRPFNLFPVPFSNKVVSPFQ